MSVANVFVYIAAAVLVVIALTRSHSLKARRIKGNVAQMRDNSGTINQTYTETRSAERPEPDRIAWAIGMVGVLIAAAQLAHDVFWAK